MSSLRQSFTNLFCCLVDSFLVSGCSECCCVVPVCLAWFCSAASSATTSTRAASARAHKSSAIEDVRGWNSPNATVIGWTTTHSYTPPSPSSRFTTIFCFIHLIHLVQYSLQYTTPPYVLVLVHRCTWSVVCTTVVLTQLSMFYVVRDGQVHNSREFCITNNEKLI